MSQDATFEAAHGFVTEIRLSWSQGGGGGGASRDLDSISPVSRSLIVPPPTDETVVVCTRWLRAKGRDGAPPPASAADAADAAAEEADAAEEAQERSEAERALGLLPLRSAAAAAAATSEAAGHRASGGEAYRRGDYAAALRCFEAGARADPRCVRSALNRSAALLKLARHRDALLAADRALWLSNGSSAKAYYRRAAAFTAAGDFNEALCDLDAAKVLEPADAAVAAARLKALEAREEACWSFAAACKATPPLPCVTLMDELEQFDGEEVELQDGRLALRWGPIPDADGKERPEVAREEAGPLDGRALWALEAATKRRALHVLSLHGCGLGPWGAHFVASGVRAAGGASSLETLRLNACRLRTDGCAAVASLLTLDGFAAAQDRSHTRPATLTSTPSPSSPRPPLTLSLPSRQVVAARARAQRQRHGRRGAQDTGSRARGQHESRGAARGAQPDRRDQAACPGGGGGGPPDTPRPRHLAQSGEPLLLCYSTTYYVLPTLTPHLPNQIGYRGCAALCEALRGSSTLQKLHAAHNRLRSDALWRLASLAIGHPSLLLLDLRGLRLGAAERAQLLERTKYTSVQFKVDAPGSAPAVCAEEPTGETTQLEPLPSVDASGVGSAAEAKASQPLPLPLPSDGASAEGAAEAEPQHGEAEPLPAEASGHAEAWLAELPHMNLF